MRHVYLFPTTYPRHILHTQEDVVAPATPVHTGTFGAAGVLRAVGLTLGVCRGGAGAGGASACCDSEVKWSVMSE